MHAGGIRERVGARSQPRALWPRPCRPAQFPDEYARMLAEEVTVNEWVPGPLPGKPITLAQFPELPGNEDTLTRYNKLGPT